MGEGDLLARYCDISWNDAYRLASLAVDLRITQVVNGAKGCHAMIERSLIARLGGKVPFLA